MSEVDKKTEKTSKIHAQYHLVAAESKCSAGEQHIHQSILDMQEVVFSQSETLTLPIVVFSLVRLQCQGQKSKVVFKTDVFMLI